MLASFLKLLNGDPPDRTVWTADITYWMAGQKASGTADPAWETEEGCLQLHRDLGIMPYYYYGKFWVTAPQYAPTIEFSQEKEGNRVVDRIRTPVGTLTQTSVYLPSSCSTGCTHHYVESEQDLEVLLYLLEHRRLEPVHLEDYANRMVRWREYDGLPSIGLPRSPLSAFVYEWAGLESASYLLADCEPKVAEALRLMTEQEEPILDAVCHWRPPLVHFPDNLSSDNLTSYYDAYMAETHQHRLRRLHAAGVKAVVHLDGTVRGLLPKLALVGFDAVEAITPAPAGDLEIEEIQQLVESDTVILWGGVPGVMFAPPFTWHDMEVHIRQLVEGWTTPFVVGVADQVPPDGDIHFCRRIRALLDELSEYGERGTEVCPL